MDKGLIKQVIVENQEFVLQVEFTRRPVELEVNGNYVFLGIRRAGKSYLMYQQIHRLLADGHRIEEILYLNFEDERFIGLRAEELDQLKQAYEELYASQPIFFLDEIQVVSGWEKFVRRLADKNYRVYVTGSNAQMLSSEIATTLGGRFLVKEVYPLSFREFLAMRQVDLPGNWAYSQAIRSKVARAFDTYFYYGGFPELRRFEDKRTWLSGLYQKIYFGDLVARYSLRNPDSMRLLVKKLAESVMQPSSYNRLKNIVSSSGDHIGVKTVIDYVGYLEQAWIAFSLENYKARFAERETNRKYYFIDNGILNLFIFNPDTSLLENLIAITLRRLFGKEAYYYHNRIEVDFYIPNERWLIQSSYSIANVQTKARELDALVKAARYLDARKLQIVTREEERTIEHEGMTIEVLPVWKWLLTLGD
ncbi:MAG: ATP-binding protein [Mediterranea sp.]|jgi:predicted AAA+ superfamily ATPase|nr:ATP-binding protein [Mediterranea sp.]